MSDQDNSLNTPFQWGFLEKLPDGRETYRPLPKVPMLLAGLGPPPFTVTLAHFNEEQHVVEIIKDEDGDGTYRLVTDDDRAKIKPKSEATDQTSSDLPSASSP